MELYEIRSACRRIDGCSTIVSNEFSGLALLFEDSASIKILSICEISDFEKVHYQGHLVHTNLTAKRLDYELPRYYIWKFDAPEYNTREAHLVMDYIEGSREEKGAPHYFFHFLIDGKEELQLFAKHVELVNGSGKLKKV